MRVINHTKYKTADLAAFFRAGLKAQVGAEWKSYIIEVFPRGRRRVSKAGIGYRRIWMVLYTRADARDVEWLQRIDGRPHPPRRVDIEQFARVFDHEIGHTLGLRHKDMTAWQDGPPPTWCAGLEIRPKATTALPTADDRITKREEHVRRMVEQWRRRLASAQRTLAKWRRKARYYERRAAAAPKEMDTCQL